MGRFCEKLHLKEVIKAEIQEGERQSYLKIQLTIQESEVVTFEALILLSRDPIKRRLRDGFGSRPFYHGEKYTIKIMYVKRLDAYAGLCKDLIVDYGFNPSFCVCKNLWTISEASEML